MNIVKSGTELETSVYKKPSDATDKSNDTLRMVMYSIPFVDQKTTERTRKQLENLSSKISPPDPAFRSKKVLRQHPRDSRAQSKGHKRTLREISCVDYVGFTNQHLHQRIIEPASTKSSSSKLIWNKMESKNQLSRTILRNVVYTRSQTTIERTIGLDSPEAIHWHNYHAHRNPT